MSDEIKIRKAEGTWTVRAGGAVLVESQDAMEVTEGDRDPMIFFPRADIAMAFLDRTERTTEHPELGMGQYFAIVTKSTTLPDAALSYEAPGESGARIRDYLAFFDTDKVTVERV